MSRMPFSVLGGCALALLLFWLLALLVSPPEEEFDLLDAAMTLTMVEAPEPIEEEPAEAPAEAPLPPPTEAVQPPLPEPTPPMESSITLPEPELPPEEREPVELDESLPELTEAVAEPEPEPEPQPEPQPEPAPAPQPDPRPAPEAPPVESSAPAAPSQAATEPAPQGPVDVGEVTPTNRVPPDYPARAQRRGMEGHVELQFVIRPDGSVDPSSIRIIDAQPRSVFDTAAQQAVARWQFEPANQLRRARQRLEFQLR
ncbi:energy transducer TonB [Billgrantia endophytica]|uniref:Protein TonB n=1 Tax=Billgrantia endophytica TaxID=2033802 RepID=A0A2N7TZ75_9GAMM|nr:energy transducer TonB [Halomonas endophytica]PMR73479.1 iron transporter [Halomonas endophytica]